MTRFVRAVQHHFVASPSWQPNESVQLTVTLTPHGEIADIVVSRPSGSPYFDAALIESVRKAAPFGDPPPALYLNGVPTFDVEIRP